MSVRERAEQEPAEQEPAEQESAGFPLPCLAESTFSAPTSNLTCITDEALHRACGVRVCFTNRLGGVSSGPCHSLNLSTRVGDTDTAVQANRRALMESVGASLPFDSLIVPNQVHGDHVIVIDEVVQAQEQAAQGADAIVCAKAGIPVLLTFADCVPVVAVAPSGAFAVIHSGWRGSLAGIAGKALGVLAAQAGCSCADCNVYIGPHIKSCCYQTDAQILDSFTAAFGAEVDAGDSHLDLTAAVCLALVGAGADASRIIDAGVCTCCSSDRYFSYRASGGMTGRQGAFVFKEAVIWD